MDKKFNELLKDIDCQIKQTEKYEWDEIRDIFANTIKKNGLSSKEIDQMNKRMLNEVIIKKQVHN